MELYIENQQDKLAIGPEIEKMIEAVVLKSLEIEVMRTAVEVSVLFVDNEQIQAYNRDYRGKDQPTDVLSFPQFDEFEGIDENMEMALGDIVISVERAVSQAEEYGHSVTREIGYLTAHSMFHLMGYDHDTEDNTKVMRVKEEAVLEALGITRDAN